MKIMPIIGIVWCFLSLLCILIFYESDLDAAAGWGFLGMLYALPLSNVGLINSNKKQNNNSYYELLKLNELKEKGIISENEYNLKRNDFII